MTTQPQILPFETEPPVPSIQESPDASPAPGPLVAPERSAGGNDDKSNSRTYRAKGKIANLPQDQRDQVNRMLLDGSTYKVVINAMKVHGVSLNYENVSNWHQGGHQEWLYDQEWREDTRALQESALETLGDIDHAKVNQAALHVATLQIFGALRHLKRGPLHEKLGGDSAAFARLVNALSRATREALNAQKIQENRAQANLKRLDPNRKASEKERNVLLHHWRDFFGHDLSESDPPSSDYGAASEGRREKSEGRGPKPEGIPKPEGRNPKSTQDEHAGSEAGLGQSEGASSPQPSPPEEERERDEGRGPKADPLRQRDSAARGTPNSELRTPNSETLESSIQDPASEPPAPDPSLLHSITPLPAEHCLECGTALPPLRPDGGRPSKFCPVCCFPLPPPGCCVETSIEQCPDCRANLPRVLPDGTRPIDQCLKCGLALDDPRQRDYETTGPRTAEECRMTKDGGPNDE